MIPLALAAALLATPALAHDGWFTATAVRVVDGDTADLRIDLGMDTYHVERVRILGLDTPETHRPECEAERIGGYLATERMAELLSGPLLLRITGEDRYGRTLAVVTVGGVDVAEIMIRENLARPYAGGKREGWC